MSVEQEFPVGARVRQAEHGEVVFEVVGHWRGEPRLRNPEFDTTHVASASALEVLPDVLDALGVADLLVEDHGSIVLLRPASESGQEWIDENVAVEQVLGNAVAVEPRYVEAILDGARDAGLRVGGS